MSLERMRKIRREAEELEERLVRGEGVTRAERKRVDQRLISARREAREFLDRRG